MCAHHQMDSVQFNRLRMQWRSSPEVRFSESMKPVSAIALAVCGRPGTLMEGSGATRSQRARNMECSAPPRNRYAGPENGHRPGTPVQLICGGPCRTAIPPVYRLRARPARLGYLRRFVTTICRHSSDIWEEDLLTSCVCSAMSWTCRSSHDDDTCCAASSYDVAAFPVKGVIALRWDSNSTSTLRAQGVRIHRSCELFTICGDS